MILDNQVKPIPKLLQHLPLVPKYRGITVYPWIFLRRDIYQDLTLGKPRPESVGVLVHEQVHIKRIKNTNWFKWGLKFWLDCKFRYKEELEATKAHMSYLKKRGRKFDIEKRARDLSGAIYLWCVSYEKARRELDKAWKEA